MNYSMCLIWMNYCCGLQGILKQPTTDNDIIPIAEHSESIVKNTKLARSEPHSKTYDRGSSGLFC